MHEAERKFRAKLFGLAEVQALKARQALLRLLHGVERQRRLVLRGLMFVVERGIFFLQVAGIRQQDGAQINRGGRGVNRAGESFLHQARNPAAVVKMSVGQDNRVNLPGRYGHVLPVAFPPLLGTLKQSAVDEDLKAVLGAGIARSVDEVLGAGDRAGRAQELNVHASPSKADIVMAAGARAFRARGAGLQACMKQGLNRRPLGPEARAGAEARSYSDCFRQA